MSKCKTSPEVGGMGHSVKRKEDARIIRGEGTYMDFDAVELISSNTDNKVRVDGLDGVSAKVSIGMSF